MSEPWTDVQSKPPRRFFAPFRKGTDQIATDYNFEFDFAKNGNDNTMICVFEDDNLHDAEISMTRHCGSEGWRERWEVRPIHITSAPLDDWDREYLAR